MFKNYFLVAIRNFRKNKLFAFINILGLAIGISAALVIYLLVQYDFHFDKFEKDGDRIYRVVTNMKFAGEPFPLAGVAAPLPEAARKSVTGLEDVSAVHLFNGDANVSIPSGGAAAPTVFRKQPDIVFADEHYFHFVPYQWLAGSPEAAFSRPFTVVLTERRARAYFPHEPLSGVIGRRVVYNDSIVTSVSGIVKEINENTDFIFKEFISLSTIPSSGLKGNYSWETWSSVNSNSQMLLKLSKGTTPSTVEKSLVALLDKNTPGDHKDRHTNTDFILQPLSDLHFNAKYGTYGDRIAHKPTLYGLLTVAVFLLVLGCINFINLATAQASRRAREIGVRKTMGSSRRQLIGQFLTETSCVTLAATLLSIGFTPILFKIFADFIPSDLHVNLLRQPDILLFLILLIIVVALLAGLYPAWILSSYNPVMVLKNQSVTGTGGGRRAWLRKGLTVSQFLIAQVFIMATVITGRQIYFMLHSDLGFRQDAIISFSVPFTFRNFDKPDPKRFVLLDELRKIPGIQGLSLASSSPASAGWSTSIMTYKDGKKEVRTDVEQKGIDTNSLNLFRIRLLAGRNVQQSDTIKEYLINETYLHVLGFQRPEDALNKVIRDRPIVGVVSDFHQQSLHKAIKPLVFYSQDKFDYTFHVALQPQSATSAGWPAVISRIGAAYKQLYPNEEFKYEFFDESIAKFYKSEQDISRLLKWATGLAIFISCMGLLGLVMYMTNLRKKEIGVRKVLGASVSGIIGILSRDFMRLVVIAFVLAV
ncbi:MAG: FtsX-like permease family protein, partial [Bacteroidota bacterium]|nr:FtsX-like permease family protein [Bacteroidota bacterium]